MALVLLPAPEWPALEESGPRLWAADATLSSSAPGPADGQLLKVCPTEEGSGSGSSRGTRRSSARRLHLRLYAELGVFARGVCVYVGVKKRKMTARRACIQIIVAYALCPAVSQERSEVETSRMFHRHISLWGNEPSPLHSTGAQNPEL
ncbi:hypothetical protein EYF80_038969 [Liparis tanakae]|uniref:Uncharacterized protein n=1 Tax=Liparis tanakae TaxID=230148 RepID=A0A4Z2GDS2_9TELE|nr:hypothetical protein EYF80_038969 [Liparis tanakae]